MSRVAPRETFAEKSQIDGKGAPNHSLAASLTRPAEREPGGKEVGRRATPRLPSIRWSRFLGADFNDSSTVWRTFFRKGLRSTLRPASYVLWPVPFAADSNPTLSTPEPSVHRVSQPLCPPAGQPRGRFFPSSASCCCRPEPAPLAIPQFPHTSTNPGPSGRLGVVEAQGTNNFSLGSGGPPRLCWIKVPVWPPSRPTLGFRSADGHSTIFGAVACSGIRQARVRSGISVLKGKTTRCRKCTCR